jgi:hypothetical protein
VLASPSTRSIASGPRPRRRHNALATSPVARHVARNYPPRVLPKRALFLVLAITSCGGARPASNTTNEASTTESSDPIADQRSSSETSVAPTDEAASRDPGALAARYTIQDVTIMITTATASAPVAVGAQCTLRLEYGGTYPRCLANLDCGDLSVHADSFYSCELYAHDAIGHDQMTTDQDDSPSMELDTVGGTFEMADVAEGQFGSFRLEGRVIGVVTSETPEDWRR